MDSGTIKRFWKFVLKGPTCWLWVGYKNKDGYGTFNANGKMVKAHRFVYELLVGQIPDGHELHHKCEIENCVNPDHLESVTHTKNMNLYRKKFCKRGHPRTPENVDKHRACILCR